MLQTSYIDTLHSEYYSRINFTKSPASGTGNISQSMLMSKAWRVGCHLLVQQCVSATGAVQEPVLSCLHSSCNHITEVQGTRGL